MNYVQLKVRMKSWRFWGIGYLLFVEPNSSKTGWVPLWTHSCCSMWCMHTVCIIMHKYTWHVPGTLLKNTSSSLTLCIHVYFSYFNHHEIVVYQVCRTSIYVMYALILCPFMCVHMTCMMGNGSSESFCWWICVHAWDVVSKPYM